MRITTPPRLDGAVLGDAAHSGEANTCGSMARNGRGISWVNGGVCEVLCSPNCLNQAMANRGAI